MNPGVSRTVAATFGLCGFAVAIIAGLAVDNPASRTLWAALVAMFVCHLVGLGVGVIAERLVNDHLATLTSPRRGGAGNASSTMNPSRPPGT